jgi:iron-sulfur cluster assembly accessory protein
MITLSPSATAQIDMLCKINSAYVRLALRAGGCAGYSYDWSLDSPTQDDFVVNIGDHGLIIDSHSQSLLGDVYINFTEDVFGSSWEIVSAATNGSCGCGKSVAIGGCNG